MRLEPRLEAFLRMKGGPLEYTEEEHMRITREVEKERDAEQRAAWKAWLDEPVEWCDD